ncbi:MAG: hypothetical protein DRN37_01840 [Thermoplasmata archaeon]|nr:MAG: hypothetical protein DRN37_01840 [Thermoplasmata archaeon]
MSRHVVRIFISDDFGRRSSLERRQDRLFPHADEKRKGVDRRKGTRRILVDRRSGIERRREITADSRIFWSITDSGPLHTVDGMPVCVIGPDRRSGKERRSGFDRRDFMIL